jgi:site-specific recombinase XerD
MTVANLVKSRTTTAINLAERHLSVSQSVVRTRFNSNFMIRGIRSLNPEQSGNVYMWLYFGNKRKLAFSTGIVTLADKFNSDGTISEDPDKTLILKEFARKAFEYYTELKITGRPIDLKLIKAAVLDLHVDGIPTVSECVQRFDRDVMSQMAATGELSKGTYKRLFGWNNHIFKWVSQRLGNNARLDQILPADATYFMLWLKGEGKISHNVACRIVSHLKRIMNFALENQWIERNPLLNFHKKLEKKKLEYLTEKEIETLESTKFASQAMDQLRDVFLFQCYTSLSHNELKNLTPDHLSTVDSYAYIRIGRSKTDGKTSVEQIIPLVPQALQLIRKYKDHELCKRYGRCFPVQSNQKYNALLKQIGMVTGITKRLTSHVGRRTAATNYLNGGVPLVSVSAMLGHSSTSVTEGHYTHVQPGMVVRDFAKFLEKGKVQEFSDVKTYPPKQARIFC